MIIAEHYHTIYIAPHLDDAVLSCGGQIYEETRKGRKVLVVTVMAGDPPAGLSAYAARLHQRWELSKNVVAARRQEDIAACATLGAAILHWNIPDCIYRANPLTGEALYTSDDALFGPIHSADSYLVDVIATQLASLPVADRVVAPLTVGSHVDHQLTRQAVERGFGRQPDLLEYYEDFPYVQSPGSLNFLQIDNWRTVTYSIGTTAKRAKVDAVLLYRSQLSTFFADRADLERQVYGYAASVGGERIWKRY
jgi:LmbE family N-acetylglucosaminyl deacetylase